MKMDTDDPILRQFPAKWRAYMVIGAGIVLQFTYGLVYTFGNMLPYLASYLRWKVNPELTEGDLIWLQSLLAGLPFSMLIGGCLERTIGGRRGAILGTVLYTGAVALSGLSIQHSYFQLIITLGLIAAFGQGVAYNCVLIQCQKWLPDRIGLVSGLIIAGFGSGAFVISPIQTKFINPRNFDVNAKGYFTQVELLERVPKMFFLLAIIFGILQFLALFFIAEPKPDELLMGEEDQHQHFVGPRNSVVSSTSYTAAVHYAAPTHSKSSILCSDTFFFLFFTLLLNSIWVQSISGFFKAYGQTFIHDDFFLATINSFSAICNCISRILWGGMADKASYQLSMAIACASGSLLMWTIGLIKLSKSPALYFIWICAMFCCVGATFTLIPYATHRCFGSDNFGVTYGAIYLAVPLAGVVNALLSQFLLDLWGFQILFTIVGATMFVSLFLTIRLPNTKFGQATQ